MDSIKFETKKVLNLNSNGRNYSWNLKFTTVLFLTFDYSCNKVKRNEH